MVSLLASDVELLDSKISARLFVIKGKDASSVPPVSYRRLFDLSSPIDLWLRWSQTRGKHRRFFALDGESGEWVPGTLTKAIQNCLTVLNIQSPTHGKYTSHSLLIGSHTEQILVGLTLEFRMARLGWGPRSQEMASLYFDRSLTSSAASYRLFGRSGCNPELTASTPPS